MSNGGKIKLSKKVLVKLQQYIQQEEDTNESGGILLGRFIKESKDIVIDKITTPMKGDIQTRFTFKRLSPFHQALLTKEWTKSNGTCNYLGEWHTHPEEIPKPSNVDIRNWKRKLKGDTFSSRYLYFLIVGITSIEMWEADKRTLNVIRLSQQRINENF